MDRDLKNPKNSKDLEQLTQELAILRDKQVRWRGYVEAAEKALELLRKCLKKLDEELADLGDAAVYSDTYFKQLFPRGLLTEQDYDRVIAMIRAIPSYQLLISMWEDPITALTDRGDQIHILQDMKAANIKLRAHLGSLFKHVDNIRYIFKEQSVPLPQWYQERYGFWFETAK